jgi:peptide/nickel transport system substrate-binding protein
MASHRLSRRSLLVGIGGAGIFRAVSGQTPDASPVPPIRIPKLRVGIGIQPDIDVPSAVKGMDSMWLSSLLYDAPMRWNANGTVIGGLVNITPGSRSTQIDLQPRTGAFFADGTPLTAHHIADTLLDLRDSASAWRLQHVSDITLDDTGIVRLLLDRPDESLVASLSHPTFGVRYRGQGTGPFVPGLNRISSANFRRNPLFWQIGRPHIDELEVIAIADDVQRSTAATTGEIDILPHVPLLDVPLLLQEPMLYLVGGPSNRLCHLQIRLSIPVLANVEVRRILSAAIDRTRLVNVATANQAEPASTLFASQYWSEEVEGVAGMNPSDVRQALAALGIPSDLRLHLLADNADATLANTAVVLQEQLANCGISLSITLLEGDALATAIDEGDYDLLVSYSEPWRDPHELVWPLLHSTGTHNWSGYNSVEVDTLLAAAIALPDIEFRRARYTRLEEVIQRDVPCVPLFRPYVWHAVNARYPGYATLPPATSRGLMTLLPTEPT